MIKIRKALKKDIDIISNIYRNVIVDLNEKKIDMLWGDIYPFCEIEDDIKNSNMYVIEFDNSLIGSFVMSDFDDPDYHAIKWQRNSNFVYLNRLVVDPSFQGQGIAKKALRLIEISMKSKKYETIRLTVYEHNYPAINLYEHFGFLKVSEGFWELDGKKFIGYEKAIN